ncbi:NAD(P)-dependent oxidoreductase [Streptomyces decoyicus]|uniref:NAD(P)-dependent oxidoreductase n=1 Tax=Streptomyces decoyicus TaxID=249567 RepID=UPI0038158672
MTTVGIPIVSVLGAGVIASGMIENLQKAGIVVHGYNRTRSRLTSLLSNECIFETPRDAAAGALAVISCVSDDLASSAVWTGPFGAFMGMKGDAMALECSTLSVEYLEEWFRIADAGGIAAMDAPVTGGRTGAQKGRLSFFIGGREGELQAEIVRLLSVMGSRSIYFNERGHGMKFKLAYNAMGAAVIAALGESMALVKQAGIDSSAALEAYSCYGLGAASTKPKFMAAGDYGYVECSIGTLMKNAEYAMSFAAMADLELPVTSQAYRQYVIAADAGMSRQDVAAVHETVNSASIK